MQEKISFRLYSQFVKIRQISDMTQAHAEFITILAVSDVHASIYLDNN